jgi:hypothetical protein
MIALTLANIETEVLDIADGDSWNRRDRLFALARRIAVQIETDRLSEAA